MPTTRLHRAVAKHDSGRMTGKYKTRDRKEYGHKFVTVIFSIGVALVFTFLLWTFALVLLQAVDQWKK